MIATALAPQTAAALCDPESDADAADIATAQVVVAAACDCSGVATHGSYVRCAAQTANEALVNRSCAKHVKTCGPLDLPGTGLRQPLLHQRDEEGRGGLLRQVRRGHAVVELL